MWNVGETSPTVPTSASGLRLCTWKLLCALTSREHTRLLSGSVLRLINTVALFLALYQSLASFLCHRQRNISHI